MRAARDIPAANRRLVECRAPPGGGARSSSPFRVPIAEKIIERSAPHELATALAAAWAEIDEVIRGANDLLFMLDDQQSVALVAQAMHDPHEPAHVARVQADARFIHDKERVDQRRAQTRRQVYPLHFAATQRARRAIQREITNADLAQIIQARPDFVPQQLSCLIARGNLDAAEKLARIGDGKRLELGQGKKNGSVFRRVLWRLRNAGQFGERSRGSLDFVVQSFWLITFSSAFGTSDVSAVSAEQHAHMHLVGLAFQPPEKAAHAVPAIVCVIFVGIIRPRFLAFDDEVLVGLWQLVEWDVDVDLFARACPQQILLRFAKLGSAENAHGALPDAEAAIRDRLVQIDGNGAAKPAAFRTGAQRVVETEQPRCRRPNVEVAICAVPAGGERNFGWFAADAGSIGVEHDYVEPALAKTERRFDCLDQSAAVFIGNCDSILNYLDAGAEAFDIRLLVHAQRFVGNPDAEITLALQKLEKFPRLGFGRNGDPERDEEIASRAITQDALRDGLRGFGPNLTTALWAKRFRHTRPEQFQIIVNLGHGAYGGARALDGIRLFDGDGRRDAADVVHARLVHAVEELPHVRAKRFDVTPLAFGVDGFKRQ